MLENVVVYLTKKSLRFIKKQCMLFEIIVSVNNLLIKLLFTPQKYDVNSEVKRCKRRKMKCYLMP